MNKFTELMIAGALMMLVTAGVISGVPGILLFLGGFVATALILN